MHLLESTEPGEQTGERAAMDMLNKQLVVTFSVRIPRGFVIWFDEIVDNPIIRRIVAKTPWGQSYLSVSTSNQTGRHRYPNGVIDETSCGTPETREKNE